MATIRHAKTGIIYIGIAGTPDDANFAMERSIVSDSVAQKAHPDVIAEILAAPHITPVVSDFRLLSGALAQSIYTSGADISVLPPLSWDSEALSAHEVSQHAARNPDSVYPISMPLRDSLLPFLRDRARSLHRLEEIENLIFEMLSSHSTAYAEIIRSNSRLTLSALAILKQHPTPHTLLEDGPYHLLRRFGDQRSLREDILIDRLASLGREAQRLPFNQSSARVVETLIPGLIEEFELIVQRMTMIDLHAYEAAKKQVSGYPSSFDSQTVYDLPEIVPYLPYLPTSNEDNATIKGNLDLSELYDQAREIYTSRGSTIRDATSALSDYYRIYSELQRREEHLSLTARAELDLWGQLLAVDAGDFSAETRHSSAALRTVSDHESTQRSNPEAPVEINHLVADSEIAHAIAEVLGVDSKNKLTSLYNAVRAGSAATADRVGEGLSVLALTLALGNSTREAADLLYRIGSDCPKTLSHRASTIATHLVSVYLPAHSLRLAKGNSSNQIKQLSSQRDVYQPYALYLQILMAIAERDLESGLSSYEQIRNGAEHWPQDRHLYRRAELLYSLLNAATGDLARARSFLDGVISAAEAANDAALQREAFVVATRFDVAAGLHERVLAATSPDGPLSPQIASEQQNGLLAAILMLRGTAVWETGDRELSSELFERALRRAEAEGNLLYLLALETPQFREWLTEAFSQPDSSLPSTLSAHILAKSVFIQRTLPILTKQQSRVLFHLSTGKSTATIAQELSVSNNTLKTHLRHLYNKLEVHSREQAMVVAEEYGLLSPALYGHQPLRINDQRIQRRASPTFSNNATERLLRASFTVG